MFLTFGKDLLYRTAKNPAEERNERVYELRDSIS